MKQNTNIKLYLTVLYAVAIVASNLIGGKEIQLPFGIIGSSGNLVFPITYILSDIFSEVYGYKWSRITCFIGFLSSLFVTIVTTIAVLEPAYPGWTMQEAFATVYSYSPRVLLGSFMAFVIGDWGNDLIFRKMKEKHQNSMKGFSIRAIFSSIFGEIVDSFVFCVIVFGIHNAQDLISVFSATLLMKLLWEVICLPLTTRIVRAVYKHENVEFANSLKGS